MTQHHFNGLFEEVPLDVSAIHYDKCIVVDVGCGQSNPLFFSNKGAPMIRDPHGVRSASPQRGGEPLAVPIEPDRFKQPRQESIPDPAYEYSI